MSRDRPGLQEPQHIDQIQERLIHILKNVLMQESCNNDEQLTMQKLREILQFLRPMQCIHRDYCMHVIQFRSENSKVELPPLYKELFSKTDYAKHFQKNLPSLLKTIFSFLKNFV